MPRPVTSVCFSSLRQFSHPENFKQISKRRHQRWPHDRLLDGQYGFSAFCLDGCLFVLLLMLLNTNRALQFTHGVPERTSLHCFTLICYCKRSLRFFGEWCMCAHSESVYLRSCDRKLFSKSILLFCRLFADVPVQSD